MHTSLVPRRPGTPAPRRPAPPSLPNLSQSCRCKSSSEQTRFIQIQPMNRGSLAQAPHGYVRARTLAHRRPTLGISGERVIPDWNPTSHCLAAGSRDRRAPAPPSESPEVLPCGGPISSASISIRAAIRLVLTRRPAGLGRSTLRHAKKTKTSESYCIKILKKGAKVKPLNHCRLSISSPFLSSSKTSRVVVVGGRRPGAPLCQNKQTRCQFHQLQIMDILSLASVHS